jgi:predicted ester cyclase
VGTAQFCDYLRWLTLALENYTSDIFSLVEEGDVIAGKLRFHGIHRGPLFGVAGTGLHVGWHGAPIFTFEGDRIRDLWVLGDIHGLLKQLTDTADALEFRATSR